MGAGLQASLGFGVKTEKSFQKKCRLSDLLADGGDINQVIQEYILPIDGIISTHHIEVGHDEDDYDEKESGHKQVIRINEMLRNLKYKRRTSFIEFLVPLRGRSRMQLSATGIKSKSSRNLATGTMSYISSFSPGRRAVGRRISRPNELEYHPEVCRVSMCRAYLYAAEIDPATQGAGSIGEDTTRIEMTIHGYLFFPPFHTSERFHELPPKKVLRLYPPEVELAQSSSKVAIEMPAYLHDPNGAEDILRLLGSDKHVSQLAPLKITCRAVEMARHSEDGGDPVLDAWLPVSDIERQLEFMLNEHMSEKLWHPD